MNTPPVTSFNQALLQVIPGVNPAAASGGTPNQVATIAAGSLITGNVYGRDATGHTQLETPDGMISLKMDLFIKRGIEVVLKMEQVQKDMFARIISVDGKSLAKYMESIGMSAPQQDSIAHSSPLLQTPNEPAATSQPTQPGSPAQPKDVANTLKAILVSPPFIDGDAPVLPSPATTGVPAPVIPPELESLPPEIKLILLKAQIGTALKIDITKLELPQQFMQTIGSQPSQPAIPGAATTANPAVNPSPLNTAAAFPIASLPSTPLPPLSLPVSSNLAPLPSPQQAAASIPASIPLPGNAASALPLTVPVTSAIPLVPETTPPIPNQVAPAGVAHILNQAGAVVEELPETALPLQATRTLASPPPAPAAPEAHVPVSVATLLQDVKPTTPPPQQPVPPLPTAVTDQSPLAPAYKPFAVNQAQPMPQQTPYVFAAPSQSAPAVNQQAAPLAQPPQSPVTLANSPILSATVIASSPDGQVTLQTPIGTLNLFSPTQLPIGTKLSFTIAAIEPAPEADTATPAVPTSGKPYKGLGEIGDLPYPIPYANPDIATPRLVPRPGAALSAEILFLLAALKGGDVRKWLGEPNAKELEKTGKLDLFQRISQDFTAMRGSLAEARDPGTWMQATIPLFHQGLQSLQWFQKRGEQQGKDKSKSSFDEHFLVDFHLTQLGHMQLDGMVKRQNPGYSFDLTVRSETPLTPAMLHDIQSIYAEAQQIGGFKGMLVFRAGLGACVKLETFHQQNDGTSSAQSILA